MKHPYKFFVLAVASAAFFIAGQAAAQNAGTVTANAFAIGKGAGHSGYASLLCGAAQLAVGQSAAAPICKTITGDVTISAGGVTSIGSGKVTSGMLNADVLSTAHTWSATQTYSWATPSLILNSTSSPADNSINFQRSGTSLWSLGTNVGVASEAFTLYSYGVPGAVLSFDPTTGVANFPLTTASTSKTTGAVKIGGGLGVAGAVNANSATLTTPLGAASGGTGLNTFARSGNTTTFATTSGTLTNGNCVSIDASGNLVDAGAACGTGSGGSSVFVLPSDYGAACDGVTDDAIALQNALNASANKTLFIPSETCLSGSALDVPSNVTILGASNVSSVLKFTTNPGLRITNRSFVTVSNIRVTGTNSVTSWSSSSIGPIRIEQDSSSVAAGSNITIQNNRFDGWNTTYWMYAATSGSNFPLNNVKINNNIFTSDSTNIPTDATPTNNTNHFIALFSNTAGKGRINNLEISGNRMEATGVCFGVIDFANTVGFQILNNSILNPGVSSPAHCTNGLGATNAYGIAIYDLNADGNQANNGLISGNYIYQPQAAGIYWVGNTSFTLSDNSTNSTISNNLIVGQSHSDTLLPRGAISISGTTNISVIGNTLLGNASGINIWAQNAGSVTVLSNQCATTAGGGVCLTLGAGFNGSSNADRRSIRGNLFDAETAVNLVSATGSRFNSVELAGNTLRGTTTAINGASQFSQGIMYINGNSIRAGTTSFSGFTGSLYLYGNPGMNLTVATLPAAENGSSVFVTDGTPATACTGSGTGSTAFRQNSAWKCL